MSKNNLKYNNKPLYKAIIIVSCIVVVIPLLVFAITLIDSSIKSGSPISGSRFDEELNPEITNDELNTLSTTLATVTGVEKVDDVNLNSGSLRIYVDVEDNYTKTQISTLAETIYEEVNKTLPIETYFTNTDSTKMYDLSIYVYNYAKKDDEWCCYLIKKNAASSEKITQTVSDPKDSELAQRLEAEAAAEAEGTTTDATTIEETTTTTAE